MYGIDFYKWKMQGYEASGTAGSRVSNSILTSLYLNSAFFWFDVTLSTLFFKALSSWQPASPVLLTLRFSLGMEILRAFEIKLLTLTLSDSSLEPSLGAKRWDMLVGLICNIWPPLKTKGACSAPSSNFKEVFPRGGPGCWCQKKEGWCQEGKNHSGLP